MLVDSFFSTDEVCRPVALAKFQRTIVTFEAYVTIGSLLYEQIGNGVSALFLRQAEDASFIWGVNIEIGFELCQ